MGAENPAFIGLNDYAALLLDEAHVVLVHTLRVAKPASPYTTVRGGV
jgi:hypothetical protein